VKEKRGPEGWSGNIPAAHVRDTGTPQSQKETHEERLGTSSHSVTSADIEIKQANFGESHQRWGFDLQN
jgi:hypothetical protein